MLKIIYEESLWHKDIIKHIPGICDNKKLLKFFIQKCNKTQLVRFKKNTYLKTVVFGNWKDT